MSKREKSYQAALTKNKMKKETQKKQGTIKIII